MNDQANYRQQWSDGEIEAGTLLDAIDSLQYANTQLAQKFAVAHQQAEALRADRDSWRDQAEQRLEDWDRMRQERDGLRAEIETARRLLRDADWSMHSSPLCQSGVIERCCCRKCVHSRIDAFLTATPAPEVQEQREPAGAANVRRRNENAQVEQGERQEPIGRIGQSHGGTVRFPIWNTEDGSEPPVGTMLYTTPQRGPDVRGLVEALEVSVDYLDSNALNSIASGSTCHRKMRNALAAHRQAQRKGESDDT